MKLLGLAIMALCHCVLFHVSSAKDIRGGNILCESVFCSTNKNKKHVCEISGAKKVISVELQKDLSSKNCAGKNTFGKDGANMWVKSRCNGKFKVCFEKETDKSKLVGGGGKRDSGKCTEQCCTGAYCDKKGKCRCNAGYSGDGITHCEPVCICTASGDPHYIPNDGSKKTAIHFQGACKYILSEYNSTNKKECQFRAVVQNEHRDDNPTVAVTKYVEVFIQGHTIRLGPKDTLLVNGNRKNPPVINNDFTVDSINGYIRVRTKCNVTVSYDFKHRVVVNTPKELGDELQGLCGNCNGNSDDDCVDKSGKPFPLEDGKCPYAKFGNSWLVPSLDQKSQTKCHAEPDIDVQCDEDNAAKAKNINLCGHLDMANPNSIFKQYLDKLQIDEPGVFDIVYEEFLDRSKVDYDNCLFDTCNELERDEDGRKSACRILSDFVAGIEETCKVDLPVWQSESFCAPECKENEMFYTSLQCDDSCYSAGVEAELCRDLPPSGCGCKPGLKRSGTECVLAEECGCRDPSGSYFKLNERVVDEDCKNAHTCEFDNDRNTTVMKKTELRGCHELAKCQAVDGDRKCVCNNGLVGDGETKCEGGCGPNQDKQCHHLAKCEKVKKGKRRFNDCVCQGELEGNGVDSCEETCTCSCWGDPHCYLYDGQRIDYQGGCRYTFSHIRGGETCDMKVETKFVQSEKKTGKLVSRTREVRVVVNGDEYTMKHGGDIFKGDEKLFGPPERKEHYEVLHTIKAWVIELKCGVSVSFDGTSRVYVKIPRKLGNLTEGLCGNCDGKKNDYVTKSGQDVSDKVNRDSLMGDSWRVIRYGEIPDKSCNAVTDIPAPCTDEEREQARTMCKPITRKEIFGRCAAMSTANTTLDDCIYDVCVYRGQKGKQDEAVCNGMTAMHDYCLKEKVVIKPWRTSSFCPEKSCDASKNMKYSQQYSPCDIKTCRDRSNERQCSASVEDIEGCVCNPDSLFQDSDQCVPEKQCGCIVKGNYYPLQHIEVLKGCKRERVCIFDKKANYAHFKTQKRTGCKKKTETCDRNNGLYDCVCKNGYERINGEGECKKSCHGEQCHKNARCNKKHGCKCKKGYSGDGVNTCDKEAERCICTANGDPHYKTFDRAMVHFMGHCKYKLSEYKDPTGSCSFKVEVQNEKRKGKLYPSYTKYMDATFGGYMIRFDQNNKIFVNGMPVSLPYKVEGSFHISKMGRMITMTTDKCNYRFSFDGKSSAKIDVPAPKSKTDYIGICGNCDGIKNNDMVVNGNDLNKLKGISKKMKHNMYGDFWYLGDDTGIPEKQCKSHDQGEQTCSKETQRLAKQKNKCGLIKDTKGKFRKCLKELDKDEVRDIYDSCLEDVCINEGLVETENDLVCKWLAVLEESCVNADIPVNWRNEDFCAISECTQPHKRYEFDINRCQETCGVQTECTSPPVDGCVCEGDLVLSNNNCVDKSECGCTYNETNALGEIVMSYMELGQSVTNSDCTERRECVKEGEESVIMLLALNMCAAGAKCQLEAGGYECVSNDDGGGIFNNRVAEDQLADDIKSTKESAEKDAENKISNPKGPKGEGDNNKTPNTKGPKGGDDNNKTPNTKGPKGGDDNNKTPNTKGPKGGDDNNKTPNTKGPKGGNDNNKTPNTKGPKGEDDKTKTPNTKGEDVNNKIPTTKGPEGEGKDLKTDTPETTNKQNAGGNSPSDDTEKPCDEEKKEPTLPPKIPGPQKECIDVKTDPKGINYFGTKNKTRDGKQCDLWSNHRYYSENSGEEHFCRNRPRNPNDAKKGPWCYTTSGIHKEWGYCEIPNCNDDGMEPTDPATEPPITQEEIGCYEVSDSGQSYDKHMATTKFAEKCMYWNLTEFKGHSKVEENYCRNPDKDMSQPWCFVKSPSDILTKVDCGVPACSNPNPEEEKDNPPKCQIETITDACKTVTTLTGSCEQKFDFGNECKYTVKQLKDGSFKLYLPIEEKTVVLNHHEKGSDRTFQSANCGLFEARPNAVISKRPTCGMCIASVIKELTSLRQPGKRPEDEHGLCPAS